jgi:tetratricopeptide (TPR) repeat protein
MLNIPELEQRWMIYRLKRLIPFAAGVIAACAAAIVIMLWPYGQDDTIDTMTAAAENAAVATHSELKNEASRLQRPLPQNAQGPSSQVIPADSLVSEPEQNSVNSVYSTGVQPPAVQKEASSNLLKPSYGFIQNIEEEIAYSDITHQPQKSTSVSAASEKFKVPQTKPEKKKAQSSSQKIEKPAVAAIQPHDRQVLIRHQDDDKDIQDVIKRFKKNKNPALSLFVAKKYYAMGVYDQAYNYALITNELNNEIEDSWLIFAKALVKLGKKEMAEKTLRSYIRKTNSVKAKILLDDISKGTFE